MQIVPRGRPRDGEREQAILDGAVELLGEVGYDLLTLDALAARVRASKATLYRRWAGKAELVCEALHRCKAVDPIVVDTGTVRADLVGAIVAIGGHMQGDFGSLMAGVMLAARRDPDLATALHEQLARDKQELPEQIVARGVARGELPAGADPQLFTELVPGALFFRVFVTGDPVDTAFAEHLVDDVLLPLLHSTGTRRQPV